MLLTEPVVFFFSLWVSFSWAVLYLQFSSVPLIFRTNHNFTIEQTGAVFTSMCVGVIIITIISIYQERIAMRFGKHTTSPEGRLYFVCIESVLLPIGLFWFGWSSFSSVHWIVPAMAVGCATMGIFSIYLATFNYLADTYHRYASSAIAAQSCCKFFFFLFFSFSLVVLLMKVWTCVGIFADIFLTRPEYARWYLSTSHQCHVHQPGLSRGIESAGRTCKLW